MESTACRPKSVDQLTFTDNGMFQAVLHEPGVCAELVERLLGVKIKKVEYPELEKTIAPYYISKGVRLDVYAKDADGLKVYNIELQATDTKELPERSRYYQGVIDVDLLKSGQKYKDLQTSFVIFIC
ncbi:MAG: PD-(D/E)XK nuclease family transposase, partial [Treponema sp.]|nr:PD-(D/E)XK nuclease family transposase [Treponema sp.]